MTYLRYSVIFPEVQAVRDRLEADFNSLQADIEKKAAAMSEPEARKFLTAYSHRSAQAMMDEWKQLAQTIIVKYNDMAIKQQDANGQYLKTPGGNQRPVKRPGYPEFYKKKIISETGDRYLVK
jgi:hypothetical protein